MARGKRYGRQLDGVLLLDKSPGSSSNQAIQSVKRLYQAQKVGHGGTLDPFASGLLVVFFGQATKFARFSLDGNKRYYAEIALGQKTDSGDHTGQIIDQQTQYPKLSHDQWHTLAQTMLGEQWQQPPMHSAIKVNGTPLYRYAHQGQSIARASRRICVDAIDVVDVSATHLALTVHCSKGTYIRTLAEDLVGQAGLLGHVRLLRREAIGTMTIDQATSLATLEQARALDAYLLASDLPLRALPSITLSAEQAQKFCHGQTLNHDGSADEIRVYHSAGHFLGLGCCQSGVLSAIRLLNTAPT